MTKKSEIEFTIENHIIKIKRIKNRIHIYCDGEYRILLGIHSDPLSGDSISVSNSFGIQRKNYLDFNIK